jgi:hypothetical protein
LNLLQLDRRIADGESLLIRDIKKADGVPKPEQLDIAIFSNCSANIYNNATDNWGNLL